MNIEQFGDLLTTTLANFEEPDYTLLTTDQRGFPAAERLLPKIKQNYKSGKSCTFRVKIDRGNQARNIAITDHDQVNIVDGFIAGEVNWRKSESKYAFYEEEQTINMTPKRLVNLIQAREDDAKAEWIELLEQNFWSFPAAADVRTPLGLPYWVTKNATTGFNGGIPTGYTTVASINPTTYPRYQNYTGQYAAPTTDDFVRKARLMRKKTKFKPAVKTPEVAGPSNLGLFSNLNLTQRLADLGEARNDNNGTDLSKYDDQMMLGRVTIEEVPYLEADTTDPFYQLDFGTMKACVLSNWWMKRKVISPYPGQRNVSAVFIDTVYQFVCYDRRRNGVLALGVTYP